jgi:hypothetical protein
MLLPAAADDDLNILLDRLGVARPKTPVQLGRGIE